jgi:hypothetical protein
MKRTVIARLASAVVVSGGLGLAGLGLTAGTAQADPQSPGPFQWCPGQPLPGQHYGAISDPTRNITIPPHDITVIWDNSVCHTYWYTPSGRGNVPMSDGGKNIWDGPDPPPYFQPVCAPFVPPINCRPQNG